MLLKWTLKLIPKHGPSLGLSSLWMAAIYHPKYRLRALCKGPLPLFICSATVAVSTRPPQNLRLKPDKIILSGIRSFFSYLIQYQNVVKRAQSLVWPIYRRSLWNRVTRSVELKKKTLHGDRVPEDKPDFIFSSEHHASQSVFFLYQPLLLKEYSMLVKYKVVAGKIKVLEEILAQRYKSSSNCPKIEPKPLPERCFRCIAHSCTK